MCDDPAGGNLWYPISIWPDPLTEAIVNAQPTSRLFREFLDLVVRTRATGPIWFFRAADVAGVLHELDVDFAELAEQLEVPTIFGYALAKGWHRPGLRGLALIAQALDVPISRFFVDQGKTRFEVRRFHSYRIVATRANIFREDWFE